MKKWLSLCLVVLLLCGCGGTATSDESGNTTGCKVLNIYNTGEYIGENTIGDFEAKYGVKVNYSLFASNEEMYTKLLSGTSYDLVIPSDYMIERLINEGMLQEIDLSKITNFDNIYAGVLNKNFDATNQYHIPYAWGNVGIVYDTTLIASTDVESQGWEVLRNEKYKGMLYMYDSERDSFMVALKALGYSMNTESEAELNEAYEWLGKLHDTMEPAYVTDEAIDGLINGEKAMGVMYSGDAAYILSENENMAFFVPNEGTNIWVDGMVIPANAKCADLAHEFINFVLEDEVAYDISQTIGYAVSNKNVLEQMSSAGGLFEGNNAYLVRTDYDKDEEFVSHSSVRQLISELWVKVKNR